MISQDVYMDIMDIPPIPYLDKVFIKLNKLNLESLSFSIKGQLEIENQQNYDFDVISLLQTVTQQELFFTLHNKSYFSRL